MTESQKKKSKFRSTKKWKLKKLSERKRAGGKDEITLKPLRKGWQLHHQNLSESKYEDMSQPFVCCNNLTHKFLHWAYIYYRVDTGFIDRLIEKLEEMRITNESYIC